MKRAPWLLWLVAGTAFADVRDDFAWHWPLPLSGAEGLVAVELRAEVYARLTRADLRDLVVFNGDNAMVPMAAWDPPALQHEAEASLRPVPWFRVAGADERGEPLALSVERGDDGRLSRVRAELGALPPGAREEILVDLSVVERPVVGLVAGIATEAAGGLNARVDIEGSDDLSHWRPLARGLALIDLQAQGERLERHLLSLSSPAPAYVRLRRLDSRAPLPLDALHAQVRGDDAPLPPPLRRLQVDGRADPAEAGTFRFDIDGPYPLSEANLLMAASNGVAEVVISSRDDEAASWRQRARFIAFALDGEGGESAVRNLPVALPGIRDRHWRVHTQPPLASVPRLEFGYRPDRFLLATQGEAPFVLAAGSVRVTRPAFPLQTVFDSLRASRGEDWQPALIEPGAGGPLAGEAALLPLPAPLPWRRWLLWAVLAGGAAFLLLMVLTLLRQPR